MGFVRHLQSREIFCGAGLGIGRLRIGRRECPHGGRARVERFESRQRTSLVTNHELAVEELVHLDAATSVGRAVAAWGDGQAVAVERDRVVLSDDALVLEAEDVVRLEAGGPGEVGGSRLGGRDSEAGVVARQEALQDLVSVIERGGPGLAQRFDEAVLESAEEALNAALGLGRVGRDELDGQFVEEATELAARGLAGQLFGDGSLLGALEDGVAVGVEGQGKAMGLAEVAQEQEIAGGVFFGAEDSPRDLTGGIIDGGNQAEFGPAVFEPRVVAAVDLEEHARLGAALSPAAVARGTALAGARQADLAANASHAGTRDGDAVVFGEDVGQVMVVIVGVMGGSQGSHILPYFRRKAPLGRPTPVTVDQACRTVSAILSQETPHVAQGELQLPSGLGASPSSGKNLGDYEQALLLSNGQCHLCVHKVTFSLNH